MIEKRFFKIVLLLCIISFSLSSSVTFTRNGIIVIKEKGGYDYLSGTITRSSEKNEMVDWCFDHCQECCCESTPSDPECWDCVEMGCFDMIWKCPVKPPHHEEECPCRREAVDTSQNVSIIVTQDNTCNCVNNCSDNGSGNIISASGSGSADNTTITQCTDACRVTAVFCFENLAIFCQTPSPPPLTCATCLFVGGQSCNNNAILCLALCV